MYEDSGRSSNGAITRSASANASATSGTRARSPRSMFTYWEPCPVYRNATFGAGPRPRKMPCARSIRHTAALAERSASAALRAFADSSAASP